MAKLITIEEIPTAARQKTPTAANPQIARNAPPIAEPRSPSCRWPGRCQRIWGISRASPAGDGFEGYYPGQKSKNAHVLYVLKLLGNLMLHHRLGFYGMIRLRDTLDQEHGPCGQRQKPGLIHRTPLTTTWPVHAGKRRLRTPKTPLRPGTSSRFPGTRLRPTDNRPGRRRRQLPSDY